MITIQNGKLTIPDNDRFVGFAGDNSVNTKQFFLIDHVRENCTYTLCLRFDDDTVRTVPLTAVADGDDTVLTWQIRREQLYASGIAAAQIRFADSNGTTAHSTKDFFLIGSSVELDEDGAEAEYVTPSQLRQSINQALERISATAPYIDSNGYWCIYQPESGEYMRTAFHVSGIAPDSAMSDSSENTVGNKFIKQYVDGKAADCNTFASSYTDLKTADKVPSTRTVANLPLSADITIRQLMEALRPALYKTNVVPGRNPGTKGEIGIGPLNELYFCIDSDVWKRIVIGEEMLEKMDVIFEVEASEINDVDEGSMYYCGDVLYAKYDNNAVALAKANNVYTKTEIDTMLGDVESLLATV